MMSRADTLGYREKAIEEYGEHCQGCGSTESVVVHHRDGDRSNNDLGNLTPLCVGCHAAVHARSDEFPELVRELGHKPRPRERSSLVVSNLFLDALYERKNRGETNEDVLWRLLGKVEAMEQCGESNE